MPATRKAPARKATGPAEQSIKRVSDALDSAQKALASMRRDVGKGTRDALDELEKRVKDVRHEFARASDAVREDVLKLDGRAHASRARSTKRPATTARKRTARSGAATRRKTPPAA